MNLEEEAGSWDPGGACRINSDLNIREVIDSVGIADVVLGVGEMLLLDGATRKLRFRSLIPGKKTRDVEDRVDASKG